MPAPPPRDSNPDANRPKKRSSVLLALAAAGGLLLLTCAGLAGAVYWFVVQVREVAREAQGDPDAVNTRVIKENYNRIRINMTRAQVDQILGSGATVGADDLPDYFQQGGQEQVKEWAPRAAQNRVVAWHNGGDVLLVCFYPGADEAGKVQAKAWEPNTGAAEDYGSPNDQIYRDKLSKIDPGTAPAIDLAKEPGAQVQIRSVQKACEIYYINPNSGGEYPKSLTELVKPPWGGSGLLNNGEADLIDPWGKPLRYELAADKNGAERPFIWSERVVDGQHRVVGTKPPGRK